MRKIQYQPKPGEGRKWEEPWAQRVREVKAASIARWGAGYAHGHEPWRKDVAEMLDREFGEDWAKARLEEARKRREEQALAVTTLGLTLEQEREADKILAEFADLIDRHREVENLSTRVRTEKDYPDPEVPESAFKRPLNSEERFNDICNRNAQLYGDRTSEGSSRLFDNEHPPGAPLEFYKAVIRLKDHYTETWEQFASRLGVGVNTAIRLAGGSGSVRPDGKPSIPSRPNCRKLAVFAESQGWHGEAGYFKRFAESSERRHSYPEHRQAMPKSQAQIDAEIDTLRGRPLALVLARKAKESQSAARRRQRQLRAVLDDLEYANARKAGKAGKATDKPGSAR